MRILAALLILISARTAHAGMCESLVTGLFTFAHNLFDKTGRSYGFAKALSDIQRLASSTHYHEMPGASSTVLDGMIQEFQSSPSVTAEEKAKFYEEVVKIFLAEAARRAGPEHFTNNVGYGQNAIMVWIVLNASRAANKPEIQRLFVDAIGRLQRTESRWTRIMLERVLLELGAHPGVGFERSALQLLDRIELRDKVHLTSEIAALSASVYLKPYLFKWRSRVELEVLREDLVPAFNEYNLKQDMQTFNRWLNGHVHNGLGLDGPNGYYDQNSLLQAIFSQDREKQNSKNKLNNVLHNVLHNVLQLRILLGLRYSDRAGPETSERREPRFVDPAILGALAIMSYMSMEKRLGDEELKERRDLILTMPIEVQFRLLKKANSLGTLAATEEFLRGNLSVDPLRNATVDFSTLLGE